MSRLLPQDVALRSEVVPDVGGNSLAEEHAHRRQLGKGVNVEMRRPSATDPVAKHVGRHGCDLRAAFVDDRESQPGDRQNSLERRQTDFSPAFDPGDL